LQERIKTLNELIINYKNTRFQEYQHFKELEEESKTHKLSLVTLSKEIQEKEQLCINENKILDERRIELIEAKKEDDKFKYNKRKLEAKIIEISSYKREWEFKVATLTKKLESDEEIKAILKSKCQEIEKEFQE